MMPLSFCSSVIHSYTRTRQYSVSHISSSCRQTVFVQSHTHTIHTYSLCSLLTAAISCELYDSVDIRVKRRRSLCVLYKSMLGLTNLCIYFTALCTQPPSFEVHSPATRIKKPKISFWNSNHRPSNCILIFCFAAQVRIHTKSIEFIFYEKNKFLCAANERKVFGVACRDSRRV